MVDLCLLGSFQGKLATSTEEDPSGGMEEPATEKP